MAAALPALNPTFTFGSSNADGEHSHAIIGHHWHAPDTGDSETLNLNCGAKKSGPRTGYWDGTKIHDDGAHTHNVTVSFPSNSFYGKSTEDNPVLPACITAIPIIKAYNVSMPSTPSIPSQSQTIYIINRSQKEVKITSNGTPPYSATLNATVTEYSDGWVQQEGFIPCPKERFNIDSWSLQYHIEFPIYYKEFESPYTGFTSINDYIPPKPPSYTLQITLCNIENAAACIYYDSPANFSPSGFSITHKESSRTSRAMHYFWKASGYRENVDITSTPSQLQITYAINGPAGAVFPFAGVGNIPAGFLLCDGQAVSRTEYSDLFAAIGILYGAGDGSTTFNVPDFRGQFLRGYKEGVSENIGTSQAEGLPDIILKYGQAGAGVGYGKFVDYFMTQDGIKSDTVKMSTASNGTSNVGHDIYGKSAHVTPMNYAVQWIIKY